MKKKIVLQQSKPKKENPPNSNPRYQLATIIISTISVLASTIIGILAIMNNRATGNSDRKIYTPVLEYDVKQSGDGKFYMEIKNVGDTTASNVTVNFSIWAEYDVADCIAHSPYQDIQPINPFPDLTEDRAITYRIPSLSIGSSFSFSCSVYYTIDLENASNLLTYSFIKRAGPLQFDILCQ